MKSLAAALKAVKFRRSALGKRYELSALLVFMCTGMLCGCGSLQALTAWGKLQESALHATRRVPTITPTKIAKALGVPMEDLVE